MFLRARLDEAAQEARAAGGGEWTSAPGHGDNAVIVGPDDGIDITGDTCDEVGAHIARHGPAAVLREIEAKRLIIDMLAAVLGEYAVSYDFMARNLADEVLRLLASPDAEHPDYQEEWKP